MNTVLRLALAVSLIAGLFTFNAVAATPADAAGRTLQLSLLPVQPGINILAGRLDGVDPSIAFVTVTVTLIDGSSRSINVDASTNWQFSFGVLPTDGWIGISITEHPIPMPVFAGGQWDYRYAHGYYYGYPGERYPWPSFPGYSYPAGYGWGYYPFGYYAYANWLFDNCQMPYYWNYPPVYQTPRYTYYGIGGLPTTYLEPVYQPVAFGTIYQPTWLVSSQPVIAVPYVNSVQTTTATPQAQPIYLAENAKSVPGNLAPVQPPATANPPQVVVRGEKGGVQAAPVNVAPTNTVPSAPAQPVTVPNPTRGEGVTNPAPVTPATNNVVAQPAQSVPVAAPQRTEINGRPQPAQPVANPVSVPATNPAPVQVNNRVQPPVTNPVSVPATNPAPVQVNNRSQLPATNPVAPVANPVARPVSGPTNPAPVVNPAPVRVEPSRPQPVNVTANPAPAAPVAPAISRPAVSQPAISQPAAPVAKPAVVPTPAPVTAPQRSGR